MPANLRDYVQHKKGCRFGNRSCGLIDCDLSHDPEPCSCGLDALLSSSSAERTEGEPSRDSRAEVIELLESVLARSRRAQIPKDSYRPLLLEDGIEAALMLLRKDGR